MHGAGGELQAETSPGGTSLTSIYVWLDGQPIALVRSNQLYHVHADHLGRPEMLTSASATLAWRAENTAFERKVVTSSIGEYNLGFPGQYYDAEGASWQNWFRTYDGSVGRYTQSDPIGLAGGLNTYAYAAGNSLLVVDPIGLDTYTIHVGLSVPFVGGLDVGMLYASGSGGPDVGVFATVQKNIGGIGRFKTTAGVSQTLGERCNFDGTDAQIHAGLGSLGMVLGGLANSSSPTSLSFDIGPQIGFGADATQTVSLTVGDFVRAVARLMHGPVGP